EVAPDQVERLKQHISVRCVLDDVNPYKVQSAMGGASRHDAYFQRLLARGLEEFEDPPHLSLACAAWEEFRQAAIREGWFKPNGAEAATLYLHIAGLLRKAPPELLKDMQQIACRENRKSAEELFFLYPEKLYERACALDPHSESFSQWMSWTRVSRPGQA